MQGGVGQHHAHLRIARAHGVGESARSVADASAQQHDGTPVSGQHRPLRRVDAGDPLGGGEIRAHHRERFAAAFLAVAERGHRAGVVGGAGEVVPAEALDREDRSPREQFAGADKGTRTVCRARLRAGCRGETELRPARRAGDRLGVETAVRRIVVLPRTQGAEGEHPHGGGGPVVGETGRDGEARPAVGAGDEGVAVAAVTGVGELAQAVRAGRGVGRDRRRAVALGARAPNAETAPAEWRHGLVADVAYVGQRRRLFPQPVAELLNGRRRAFHFRDDSVRAVEYETGQVQFGRQPVDEGAKAHALHRSAHGDLAAQGPLFRSAGERARHTVERVPTAPWS